MSKKLQVGDETFDYPITGDINYGEQASAWAEAVTDVLSEVSGPGDIGTTEVALTGTLNMGIITGNVTGLLFDTSFVQRVKIEGLITREFVSDPKQVESFEIEGAYNGSQFIISTSFVGDDTKVTFGVTGGQFTFSAVDVPNTTVLKVKFSAKVKIDEEAI